MKKYILLLVAILIIASALMAKTVKVVTTKDKDGVYTVETDGKVVLKTKDKDKVIDYLHDPWGWPPSNCQWDSTDHLPDGSVVVHCHLFALRNDCAVKAAHAF